MPAIESYDVREATIESIQTALFNGTATCRQIVASFVSRIIAQDDSLRSVICLNPLALEVADKLDAKLAAGGPRGILFGVPILLKDNFDEVNMNTTGGCRALAGLQPGEDAATVQAFKHADAIILGKTNLHEMALEGLTVSSLGGQTINPFDLSRTPGGSSGGSAVAVAASFCVFATGTDTMNSLRSPASANSLFSVRPSWSLVSRAGIMPVSYTQDVAGPIARCTRDLAVALTVMASASPDLRDRATSCVPDHTVKLDYRANLTTGSLQGLRVGLVETFIDKTGREETEPVNSAIELMVIHLKRLGSEIIPINESIYNTQSILTRTDTQRYEFREELDAYLGLSSHTGTYPASFEALFRSDETLVIPSRRDLIRQSLISSTEDAEYKSVKSNIAELVQKLEETFDRLNLDALIYPEQTNLVVKLGSPFQRGRNGILAAVTGWPVVTVPAGFSTATTAGAPLLGTVPIGMEILGRPLTEQKLLQMAYQIETHIPVRRAPPLFADCFGESGHVTKIPQIPRRMWNVDEAYPLGSCLR